MAHRSPDRRSERRADRYIRIPGARQQDARQAHDLAVIAVSFVTSSDQAWEIFRNWATRLGGPQAGGVVDSLDDARELLDGQLIPQPKEPHE